MKQTNKNLPLNRPPLYDIEELEQCEEEKLVESNRHCHWIKENEPLNKINKVENLAWFCKICDEWLDYVLKN